MPDPSAPSGPNPPGTPSRPSGDPAASSTAPKRRGWPLWIRIGLAVVLLSFVWSPFLAMLARLSRVSPSLQPTGGTPDLVPAPQAPAAPTGSGPSTSQP